MRTKVRRGKTDGEFIGFTSVAGVNFDARGYDWSVLGVWSRNLDGTLWWASDSGCSCHSPWDNTDSLERLFNLDPLLEVRREELGRSVTSEVWGKFLGAVEAALDKLRRS